MKRIQSGFKAWMRPEERSSRMCRIVDTALVAVSACLIVLTCLLWG